MENDYAGTFSTLTTYGTLNVSATRIQRKKRSRGNIVKPRDRTIALTECVSIMPDGTRTIFTPKNKRNVAVRTTRQARIVKHDAARTYFDRIAQLGATGNVE
jgi:hypothetical protein